MNIRTIILPIGILILSLAFLSCDKEKEEHNSEFKEHIFDAKSFEKWVYFSFEEDKEVQVSDFKNDLNWDIAFHFFDVRVNCGTSGIGKGGSIDMGEVNFDDVTVAPQSGYALNDSISIVTKYGEWTNQTMVPGDTVVAKWLYFTGPPPRYNITNRIFVIKTAKGKYAKIWLKEFYNDNSESGYITMQYFYQKDGSLKLE